MGLLDVFRSPRPEKEPQEEAGSLGGDVLHEATSSSTSELLSNHEVHAPPGGLDLNNTERLYNPYEGLSNAIDSRGGLPRTLYKLPKQPEFLFQEEAAVHKRSWSENLTYYTGVGYLSGATLGGGQGLLTAVRTKPELGIDTTRLRINRVLNLSGKTGRSAGNALGCLGLFYASSESGLDYLNDGRLPDLFASLGAGFLSGAVFRSTRGLKAAGIAGGVGTLAAAALVAARNTIDKNL
ncbi:g7135 [Coccomyxa elongata]